MYTGSSWIILLNLSSFWGGVVLGKETGDLFINFFLLTNLCSNFTEYLNFAQI